MFAVPVYYYGVYTQTYLLHVLCACMRMKARINVLETCILLQHVSVHVCHTCTQRNTGTRVYTSLNALSYAVVQLHFVSVVLGLNAAFMALTARTYITVPYYT